MSSTNFHLTFEKLEIIIWAILSPGLILYFSSDKLIKITPTSPLKSESIVPGEFKTLYRVLVLVLISGGFVLQIFLVKIFLNQLG